MQHRSYAEPSRRVTRSRGIPCGEGEAEILFNSGTGRRSNAKQPEVSRQIDTKSRAPRGCLAASHPPRTPCEGRTPAPSRIPREGGGPAMLSPSRSHPWIPGLAMLAREDDRPRLYPPTFRAQAGPSPFSYPPRKRGPSQTQPISFTSLDPGSRYARPGRR